MSEKRLTRVVKIKKIYWRDIYNVRPHNYLDMSGEIEGHKDNFLALGLRNSVNGEIITQNRMEYHV